MEPHSDPSQKNSPLKLVKSGVASNVFSVNFFTSTGISFRVSSLESSFKDSYHLNLEEFNKRKTIILVNGLTRTKEHWIGFDEYLADDVNVVSFDPRGVGESRKPANWSHSIDEITEDIMDILSELRVSEVSMLGFSLGGMVSLKFALKHPSFVESLVIVNSSIGGGFQKLRLSPSSVFVLATAGFKKNDAIHKKLSRYLLSHGVSKKVKDDAINAWVGLEEKYGRGFSIAFKQLFAAFKFRNPKSLSGVKAKSLVVCGEKDKFVPSSHSKRIHKYLPFSTLLEIKKGGHELHMDSREKLKSAVIGHIFGK